MVRQLAPNQHPPHQPTPAMGEYAVTCAILGDEDGVFEVGVESRDSVYTLKHTLKWVSSKFASVELEAIKLYWVQLPLFDQPYSTLVESIYQRTIEIDHETELKNPWLPLSRLPGAFSIGKLHILVELPAGESFSAWPGCDAHQLVRGAYKKLLDH